MANFERAGQAAWTGGTRAHCLKRDVYGQPGAVRSRKFAPVARARLPAREVPKGPQRGFAMHTLLARCAVIKTRQTSISKNKHP
jgi:hypothetical protein